MVNCTEGEICDDFKTAGNVIVILSNVTFLLPCLSCVFKRKYLQAFVYASVFTISSLYHACKFGFKNEADPEGACFLLTFSDYYVMDHFYALMTVPVLALYFTCLDVVVVTFRGVLPYSNERGPPSRQLMVEEKIQSERVRDDSNVEGLPTMLPRNSADCDGKIYAFFDYRSFLEHVTTAASEVVGENVAWAISEDLDGPRKTRTRSVSGGWEDRAFACNDYDDETSSLLEVWDDENYSLIKRDYSGMERILLNVFASTLAVALRISGPKTSLMIALVGSCTGVWSCCTLYFYVKYAIFPKFEGKYVYVSFLYCIVALALMGTQDRFPGHSYWIVHSVWHVAASLGQWYVIESKKRFYLIYEYRSYE